MQIELTIRAGSLSEIAHIFQASPADTPRQPRLETDPGVFVEHRAKEVEPSDEVETPAPKKSRGKKSASGAQAGSTSEEGKSGPSPNETKTDPSDGEPVTFEDIRAFASSLMDQGKVDGRAIQEMLQSKFGVKAFGPLKEKQYPEVMAELENLAA